jgi:hypothetical protein
MSPGGTATAVVLGGGMAGLLAARVLADEYARVILVERDRFPRGSEHRRGIPHGHHAHALLPRGRQVMEDLLPGLTAQLMASGALAGDVLGRIRWYLNGQRLSRTSTGLLALSASRPLRSGVMQRIEGDRVIVTLAGLLGERPPLELGGFTRYAASLAAPDIHEAVRSSRPIAEPAAFRFPAYVRRRYERLTDVPAGLFVIGDAICAFNPVYAQGMSVAALGAAVLQDEVRRGGGPDGPRFYAAMSRMLDAPWTLAVGADMAVAGVEGPPMPRSSLSHEYLAALQRRAVEDAGVAAAFIRVASLVDEPSMLLRPEIVATVTAASGGIRG